MTMSYLEGLLEQAREKRLGWEGSADKAELECLSRLASDRAIRTIGEIGFNLGFSSYTFLSSNHKAKVVSFDIAKYWYVSDAKAYIDRTFPDRHTLVVGDSLKTVPEFRRENPDIAFDLIFIDGDHSYATVKNDLANMRAFAHEDTLVVIDDLTPWKSWGEGPTKAWTRAIDKGLVVQQELFKDGVPVDRIEPPGVRAWAVGKYVL